MRSFSRYLMPAPPGPRTRLASLLSRHALVSGGWAEPLVQLVKQVAKLPEDDRPFPVWLDDDRLPRAAKDDLDVRAGLPEPSQPQLLIWRCPAVGHQQSWYPGASVRVHLTAHPPRSRASGDVR